MSMRAVILGVWLGLVVAGGTYFNDWVVNQTRFVGNLLPVSVFGTVVVLVLLLTPAMEMLRRGRGLRSAEVAVIAALGLAVCGWPGASYMRYFATTLVMPSHWYKSSTAWQAHNVMSYVPGGAALLGEGHVRRWPELAATLAAALDEPDPAAAVRHLAGRLDAESRDLLRQIAADGRIRPQDKRQLVRGFNGWIEGPAILEPSVLAAADPGADTLALVQRVRQGPPLLELERHALNRALVVAVLPEYFLPPPRGQGVLVLGGQSDPDVTDLLVQGAGQQSAAIGVRDVPWRAWWPTLRLWVSLALVLGLASLCLVLIVHPQWAHRELLPYPVARFVEDLGARESGRRLPDVAHHRLFWIGLGSMVLLHLVNGLNVWFPQQVFIHFPLRFDCSALQVLFPNAARVEGANDLFSPAFIPSVVAFTFFLTSEVSLSVGISMMAWAAFYGMLVSYGVTMEGRWSDYAMHNLVLFGATAGMALMILFGGRHHYWNVARGAVGLSASPQTPAYSIWAARGLACCILLAVWLLSTIGLDWVLSLPLVLLILMYYLVVARVNAETGAFLIALRWLPVAVLTGLFGIQAIGPTAYLLLSLVSVLQAIDVRENVLSHLANALRIADRTGRVRPPRIAPLLAAMLVLGLAVAIVVTLTLQYNHGLSLADNHARASVARLSFDRLAVHLSDLSASGNLEASMQIRGLGRMAAMSPARETLLWAGLGFVLVVGCALARLRLPWWPIHPVLFIFWGSWPARVFGWSFFAGWLIKISVVNLMGARGYHNLRPFMIGIIAGELLMCLVGVAVGAVYFQITGLTPVPYSVFPN